MTPSERASTPRARPTQSLLALLCALAGLAVPFSGPVAGNTLFDLSQVHAVAPGESLPWNAGIYSTTFAVSGKPRNGGGARLDGKRDCFVALPAVNDGHSVLAGRMYKVDKQAGTITMRVVEIRPAGKSEPLVEATVQDIGPWETRDPYWLTVSRPIAESGIDSKGRKTNRAGIDLSPALCTALNIARSDRVDWRFKTNVEGAIVTVTAPL